VLVVEELQRRPPREEARGYPVLDTARSPANPPQNIAESSSKAGGTSVKTYFRKGKTPQRQKRRAKKKEQNGSVNIKDGEGEGGGAPGTGADIPFQIAERTVPEQGKSGRGKEWQKETTMY